ncbi:uncharacterized protein V1518DRAFT_371220, partial [Limtongia smithiae]|uniref:uncharacterized protein n=1 Tax=Limtongia smithiae TaxID=1125753 RepID=UPI0034CF534E
ATHPDAVPLFDRIITLFAPSSAQSSSPPAKKRRLSLDQPTTSSSSPILLFVPGISVAVPQRKKLALVVTRDAFLLLPNNPTPPSSPIDTSAAVTILSFTLARPEITGFLCIPTPARATKSYTFVLISRATASDDDPATRPHAVVFSVPDDVLPAGTSLAPPTSLDPTTTPPHAFFMSVFSSIMHLKMLNDNSTFLVEAHRGTKDGYLVFCSAGILFGFKKPLWYAPLDIVDALSFAAITRVTFSLIVSLITPAAVDSDDTADIEFSVIDQKHVDAISRYAQQWHLPDHSMAEQRRAKRQLKNSNDAETLSEIKESPASSEDDANPIPNAGDDDEDDEDEEDDENFEDENSDDGGSPSVSDDDDDDE